MGYTINEVAKRFDVSPHTIRYYEKEGLLPFVARNKSGNRDFTESDIKIFATICCLKNTGMPIKEIKSYIDMVSQGAATVTERKKMLSAHKSVVLEQIKALQDNLKQLDDKISIYESPDAVRIITEQIEHVKEEKRRLGLTSIFT